MPRSLTEGLRTILLRRPSADTRAIAARLDAALSTTAGEHGAPVQPLGEAHRAPETYRRWRAQQLRAIPGASVPELVEEEWALVLWAMPPAALMDFAIDGRTNGLLCPPVVGRFPPSVTIEDGLAATLAAWLEGQHAVRLAPPLLAEPDEPYRVSDLGRTWPLPVAELADGLSPGSRPGGHAGVGHRRTKPTS